MAENYQPIGEQLAEDLMAILLGIGIVVAILWVLDLEPVGLTSPRLITQPPSMSHMHNPQYGC